jgi:hypothetical protein
MVPESRFSSPFDAAWFTAEQSFFALQDLAIAIGVWLLGFAALGLTQAREGRP